MGEEQEEEEEEEEEEENLSSPYVHMSKLRLISVKTVL